MRIAVAFDHRGVHLRDRVLETLQDGGHDVYSAHQGVEHDDMNVLCLGSEVIGPSLAADLVRAFLAARFAGGEPYVGRLRKVEAMERQMSNG